MCGGLCVQRHRLGWLAEASVVVIGRTRAFRRHHGSAERVLWRAGFPEGRALVRLLEPLEDQPADADVRFRHAKALDGEALFRIKFGISVAQAVAALRDRADAAPLAIGNLEY